MSRIDYTAMADRYDAGRDQPERHRQQWREVLSECVDRSMPLLDVGAGTGQWSRLLARWFGVQVVAVELSRDMLAAGHWQLPSVQPICGTADNLPIRDGSVGTIWLSAIWHHLEDPDRVADSLARAVAGNGYVIVRGAFPDSEQDLSILRYFPEASDVLATFPTTIATRASFAKAGLDLCDLRLVREIVAGSPREFRTRCALRADTLLQLLPDSIFHSRLNALPEDDGSPILGATTALIFRKSH